MYFIHDISGNFILFYFANTSRGYAEKRSFADQAISEIYIFSQVSQHSFFPGGLYSKASLVSLLRYYMLGYIWQRSFSPGTNSFQDNKDVQALSPHPGKGPTTSRGQEIIREQQNTLHTGHVCPFSVTPYAPLIC